ncbi:hypothetical protein JCM9279_006596 [Rhodotorula babjevae]
MTTSLLSLPDELLDLVVDQALGEFAPRLYEQRQETACALALVNKRVGGIAQQKLLEAVYLAPCTLEAQQDMALDGSQQPSRIRAMYLEVAHPRLVGRHLHRDSALPRPETRRLILYFCDFNGYPSDVGPFLVAGCPSLENLFLGLSGHAQQVVCEGLLAQVHTLGVDIFDAAGDTDPWKNVIPNDAVSKEALLDKTLFDVLSGEISERLERVEETKHLCIHADLSRVKPDSARNAVWLIDLATKLDVALPALETLYLPRALDTSRVMLHQFMRNALTRLVSACARRRVEVIFEHALGADEQSEDRASPHFEARCRRVKAERAAAAAASATTSGARAAR